MSDFNRREWMEENGVRMGGDWEKFQGKPRVQFCDILMKDGNDLGPCWPRDLDFVCLADETEIAFSDVTHVRYWEEVTPEESGDGEDGEYGIGHDEEEV